MSTSNDTSNNRTEVQNLSLINHPQQKFTLTEFARNDDNQEVIKTFVLFASFIAIGPILVFFITQRIALSLQFPGVTDGTIAGLVASLATLISLMAAYAYHAYQEEKRDYFAAHPEDTCPVWTYVDDKKEK